jgi:hypothetical protein
VRLSHRELGLFYTGYFLLNQLGTRVIRHQVFVQERLVAGKAKFSANQLITLVP